MKQCYGLVRFSDGSAELVKVNGVDGLPFYKAEAKAFLEAEYPDAKVTIYGIRSPIIASILAEYGVGEAERR